MATDNDRRVYDEAGRNEMTDVDGEATVKPPQAGRLRNGVPKSQLPKRPKKPKAENRLVPVVRRWLADVLPTLDAHAGGQGSDLTQTIERLAGQAPKRWVVYEPMVLLPTGSFGFTCVPGQAEAPAAAAAAASSAPPAPSWQDVLAALPEKQTSALWKDMLAALSPGGSPSALTHLAVNEGIPLHVAENTETENILRSPTGLRPLYGDFGPASTAVAGRDEDPSDADLAAAFWVGTKQNGLYQTWAPRWSMFSRGNIKEKARLLAWPGGARLLSDEDTAVDLYAGIGYFVFSYAQRGLRVLGWELNPWSTEALRRGAVRNGWTVRIVRGAELARPTREVVHGGSGSGSGGGGGGEAPQIVIFVEDNQRAARRLAELRGARPALRVTHVNGGLLPTSRAVWRTAWDAVVDSGLEAPSSEYTGWLHLHDNVGVDELDRRKAEIQGLVDGWGGPGKEPGKEPGPGRARIVSAVEHVELVKTYAPGVWHCVFDVRVEVSSSVAPF